MIFELLHGNPYLYKHQRRFEARPFTWLLFIIFTSTDLRLRFWLNVSFRQYPYLDLEISILGFLFKFSLNKQSPFTANLRGGKPFRRSWRKIKVEQKRYD